ncbi:MAG: hypothetical protein HOB32_10120 [Nitrospina sp.]|jgi:hypothetical protein|nr:hypothetical protein [Nitrospina sp.]MBT6601988.1 hypothetical protein [Nitrospina sp.]
MATIKDIHKTEEIFENCWYDAVHEIGEAASYAVDLKKIDYNEFIDKVNTNNNNFIRDFVFSFYSGTVYIFSNAFQQKVLNNFKAQMFEWSQKQKFSDPSEEDSPPDLITSRDWHLEDHGFGYSSTYDMIHFFRWNDDPVGAFELFNETYDLLHTINAVGSRKGGTDGEFNFGKVADRIEINRYPPMKGGIAFHSDPIDFTRFAFTVNLTQFGVDYKSGGFGVGLGKGKILQIDPLLEIGSMVGFLPKICHGVEIIDPHGPTDPNLPKSLAGRWYAALVTVNMEKTKNRPVTTPDLEYPTLREQINSFKH